MASVNPITREMLVNALTRDVSSLPGFYGSDTKHQYFYRDYGYPEILTFDNYMQMYKRTGLAKAGVDRAVQTCWSTWPTLQEKKDTHDPTKQEEEIAEAFERLRFWSVLAEADRLSRIGQYACIIVRYRDNQKPDQPVLKVSGGLDGVAELIPVHQGQIKPATFHSDPNDWERFGQVAMWQFDENALVDQSPDGKMRQYNIHPDRVMVWSQNGTIWNDPVLEAGFNDLLTIQKVIGAGGEGFWKNAKGAPILQVNEGAKLGKLATMLGVPESQIGDKLDEIVADYNRGLDSTMVLQGITPELLNISLADPEFFLLGPQQDFAASVSTPLKILLGSQTGERASTEDAKEWKGTCNSRRENLIKPNIMSLLRTWQKYGIIPARKWYLLWADLTEASTLEKAELGVKMADINQKSMGTGEETPFSNEEIREVMGWEERAPSKPAKAKPKDPKPDPEETD
jgi:uncharacterized protein